MPGLLRGVARTAVIAGTASAVNGRVQRRQAERFADRDAQIYASRAQAYEQSMASQNQQAPPPQYEQAPPPDRSETLDQLRQLGELKAQGILTEEEFAAEKARILGG
jgi:Short C-terminal domain